MMLTVVQQVGKNLMIPLRLSRELNEGNENTPYEDSLGNWTVLIIT